MPRSDAGIDRQVRLTRYCKICAELFPEKHRNPFPIFREHPGAGVVVKVKLHGELFRVAVFPADFLRVGQAHEEIRLTQA